MLINGPMVFSVRGWDFGTRMGSAEPASGASFSRQSKAFLAEAAASKEHLMECIGLLHSTNDNFFCLPPG